MLLKKLNIKNSKQNAKFEDVSVPELGDGAEIRVGRMTIAGSIRLSELNELIDEKGVKDINKYNILLSTASLMCVMIDEEGEYLVPENDIESTMGTLDEAGVFFKLLEANGRVNAITPDLSDDKLDTVKKSS